MRSPLLSLPLLAFCTATAQTWTMTDFTVTFVDCVRRSATQVACTFTSAYTGSEDQSSVGFQPSTVVAVTPLGQPVPARTLTLAEGAPFTGYGSITMFKGLPVRVVATFDYAAGGATLPRLSYSGHVLSNVALRGSSPGAAPTTPVNPSTYTAVLTNCQTGAGGTLTCTAILTPRK